ncbi:MAG: type II secretion system F family protein [Lachnospiraceae bacterium]|nr:type II secretion system F family protein [Lachnospiraceae bacterium]
MNDHYVAYDDESQNTSVNNENGNGSDVTGEETFVYRTDFNDDPAPENTYDTYSTDDKAGAGETSFDDPGARREAPVNIKKARKVFNSDEVSMFCDQIAMLFNGGISLTEGIYMLHSEMEDSRTKAVLKQLYDQTNSNMPFYEALKNTGAFPEYMVHMVEVGEKTGRLEDVMKSLAEYYERDSRIKSGIRSAIAYPMILFGVMACIMIILVWKILPMFERMFDELSSDVSSATENVLTVGLAAGKVIAVVILVLFALVIFMVLFGKTKTGSRVLKKLAGAFRPARKLMELMATGKFVSSMSLMLSSGMNTTDALESEYENCENDTVRKRIAKCIELYKGGSHLDEALRNSGLIVGMESRLVSVAVKTGGTDVIFTKLSEQYNERTTASLGKMTTIIETTLVIVLSVMVGAVLLAVMMPLVSMISSIG